MVGNFKYLKYCFEFWFKMNFRMLEALMNCKRVIVESMTFLNSKSKKDYRYSKENPIFNLVSVLIHQVRRVWRYQREVIRIRKSKKDRQHNCQKKKDKSTNNDLQEEFEDTKGVIGIRKSKKDRQHNGQKKKDKRTNNNLQTLHIKLKIE